MKHESHLHIDVTVPFVLRISGNELEAPKWLRNLVYPTDGHESNPLAAFLENVGAPSNIRINIHVAVEPAD
jgi:hypothetical protein